MAVRPAFQPISFTSVPAFEPELHFAKPVFTHYNKRFFTGPGNVQQVTDCRNKDNKKPHREHITSFKLNFSNTVPIKEAFQKSNPH
jgi:hypothetical protein